MIWQDCPLFGHQTQRKHVTSGCYRVYGLEDDHYINALVASSLLLVINTFNKNIYLYELAIRHQSQ